MHPSTLLFSCCQDDLLRWWRHGSGNQDYGPWPMPNVSGPLDRGFVPFGSVTRGIIVRGTVIESEGQLSVQADRNDGVSLVDAVVEFNSVVGYSHRASDGPPLQLSKNTSGWTIRDNVCDGAPC